MGCLFLPTHSKSTSCSGKVITVGMHLKGLPKDNMPRVGDVMIKDDDTSIARTASFTCQVQVLNHPGQLKVGYSPIAFVRTARSAVKMTQIVWKMGKETGGQKAADPQYIKA